MTNKWATRGKKPNRIAGAALLAGSGRFIKAIVDGEARPWVSAISHAIGAGIAMDKHRIADRERANERNAELADLAAVFLNRVFDAADSKKLTAGTRIASPTYQLIVAEWEQFVAETGKCPALVELTSGDWDGLSAAEQAALCEACSSCAAQLRVGGQDLNFRIPLLTR